VVDQNVVSNKGGYVNNSRRGIVTNITNLVCYTHFGLSPFRILVTMPLLELLTYPPLLETTFWSTSLVYHLLEY
jgi:hypothetical protein